MIFIAGNLPNVSEIAPLLIVIRLSEFRYADATAIAVVMLVVSFVIIFAINRLQRWAQSRIRCAEAVMTMQIADPSRCSADATARAHAAARDNLAPSRALRIVIIALAMHRSCVFVVLPLVVVFAQAFSQGHSSLISPRWPSRRRCPRSS